MRDFKTSCGGESLLKPEAVEEAVLGRLEFVDSEVPVVSVDDCEDTNVSDDPSSVGSGSKEGAEKDATLDDPA